MKPAAALTTLLAALLSSLPFAVCAAEPEAVFQLEPFRKTIAVRASVGGVDGTFVFDTGAGLTVLGREAAARTGCRQRQRVTGFQMTGQRLDSPYCERLQVALGAGRYRTEAGTAAIGDMDQLFGAQVEPVAGILGLDIFAGRTITIDFPGRRLIVESGASAAARERPADEVPARLSREMQGRTLSVSIGVPSAEGPVWMELDSGNGGTVLVSRPYARLFGLAPGQDGPQKAAFVLANGVKVDTDRTFTPDMIIDGNLGMPFLKEVVLTLDLGAGRAWISRPDAQDSR